MLLLPLVRAARSEARPLNFQRLALKAANFDSTGIPYEEKGKYPVLFVCRKKNQKTKHFGPYRGRIGMTLDTRPYWDHSLSKNEM